MEAAETAARGGQPAWKHEFEHPELGKLTFSVAKAPRVRDWLQHAVVQEDVAPGLGGYSGMLAAAVAGMRTFVQTPVLHEERQVDEDNPDHVKIIQHRYDPLEDEHMDFPVEVWVTFMAWRSDLLGANGVEQAKNSSGATKESLVDSSESSPGSTD